jgi:hypothetical protein|tara:strand:- start:9 stop:320 length:312 start_codon:yes stop_codon:yes gene_type:complete
MNPFNNSVTLYATFEEVHPGGSAIKVSNLSEKADLKEVLITSTYLPKSQMRLQVQSKAKKTVKITIPRWLYDAKIEDEKEREQGFASSTESELDQALTLFATK